MEAFTVINPVCLGKFLFKFPKEKTVREMRADKSYVMGHAQRIVIAHVEVCKSVSHFRSADLSHEIGGLAADKLIRIISSLFQDLLIISVNVMFQKMEALQAEHIFVTFLPGFQEKGRQVIVIQCIELVQCKPSYIARIFRGCEFQPIPAVGVVQIRADRFS